MFGSGQKNRCSCLGMLTLLPNEETASAQNNPDRDIGSLRKEGALWWLFPDDGDDDNVLDGNLKDYSAGLKGILHQDTNYIPNH